MQKKKTPLQNLIEEVRKELTAKKRGFPRKIHFYLISKVYKAKEKKEKVEMWDNMAEEISGKKDEKSKKSVHRKLLSAMDTFSEKGMIDISKVKGANRYGPNKYELIAERVYFKKLKMPDGRWVECVYINEKGEWKPFKI